ncbi:MAG: hypothetical protein A2268_02930 [Candidatus Raymondbacteria bacterium RifOxyA12_full_50_37]|uniref:Calcineurin-like phosphoesterase domain-containing protein n=1 Tax=Candidatus Raymondbacteria bacterium RIFOXYD12_FULL_49_13 TaxID=1817890 RepID=A0A1F7F8U6_UNCRA|nr:MAG: hypothetical protein A2248_17035 [Candidatus Raymondbacteria bacterium RIFOXYA2_FULL_49_16]OGJ90732.1 MAG: hypothetical protein A2268_02930 [Candidatus Raymondbacteria bacterium RifOxyA12_full_50_37]OGJ91709.1 MAG: hypothetical protein A2350_00340 [Candidatus Raymondbacteria bacterium RifOxyB12_full_50_8]OGJ98369.1 MAG: hypothetical protein A2453_08940 [Candidatus Raymondbacteria bacterium RIFOXYC2_FULL_50_21]OGK03094.1 MAG: hypothetical protein A2519_06770 [Candidatus Raymondbacteria b
MRTSDFVIFLSIVLAIYGSANYYVFVRGWQAMPLGSAVRPLYSVIFICLAFAYVMGRFLEHAHRNAFSDALMLTGSFWMAAIMYFLLIAACVDCIRFADHWTHFLPAVGSARYTLLKYRALQGIVLFVAMLLGAGFVNACHVRTTEYSIPLPTKPAGAPRSIRIAVISDIHLGAIVGKKRFDRMVNIIMAQKPDLILMPGDIVDEDITPVVQDNIGESLRRLSAPLGVFASTGNHEYIGGVDKAIAYYVEHGITVLRDSMLIVGGFLRIVGREDQSKERFTGQKRLELKDIVSQSESVLPLIVLDHQPSALKEAQENQVDLLLCGHTHGGQLWPGSVLTKAIFGINRGLVRKGETSLIVSSGAGTWGPPVRIGSVPEIIFITADIPGS